MNDDILLSVVEAAVSKLKEGKAAGPDVLNSTSWRDDTDVPTVEIVCTTMQK